MPIKPILTLSLVLLLGVWDYFETLFAPNAEPWARWETHDPASTATIDHGAWGEFLDKNLSTDGSGVNRMAYGLVTQADRATLERYLRELEAVPISRFNRPEQFAFWVNLYNALTVRLVIDHFPIAGIRDIKISPGLFAIGPWGKKIAVVEQEALSLNDIEHRILRPGWSDPRIHYAVNCASIGCPNLLPEPFSAENHQRLLDAAARAYINSPRGVRLENGGLVVSSVYNWFAADFGGSPVAVIDHLRKYADPALAERLAELRTIDGYAYDWSLNDDVTP